MRDLRLLLAVLCLASPEALVGQTASEITPANLSPQLQRLDGSIVFTGQAGTQAPPGAESIGITLSGVDLKDGIAEMAGPNAALISRLTKGRVPVSELFDAVSDLEAAYAEAGYILTRIVLPQQTLRDGGRLQVVVVNGFIERVDTAGVPEQTRRRIDGLTATLVDKPGLTRQELERQLLLAGDAPGTAMRSAIGAGDAPGGAVIALEPEFRPITGSIGFGNPSSSSLGGLQVNAGVEFNSPLKFGETFYLRASGAVERFLTDSPQSRILAAGALVPIGFTGLTVNIEATMSDTNPDSDAVLTQSSFDRQSLRVIYPFIRSRDLNLSGQASLDLQQDIQDILLGGGLTAGLHEDKLTVLRLGGDASIFHKDDSVTQGSVTLSRGLDAFGARTAADAATSAVGLSRAGADATFTKLVGSVSHQRSLSERLDLSLTGRFQSSFGDPLLISEQFTLVGPQELSAFDSGALRGDSGWVVRSELSTNVQASLGGLPLLMRPYGFLAYGEAKIEQPSALEQGQTEAWAYGFGMDIFTQTDSNFRSNSLRIEFGKGERNDGSADESRLGISANFRF